MISTLDHEDLAKYSLSALEKQSPQTQMEIRLQHLWAEILKLPMDSIGRDDSFLQIGGDSILAIHFINAAHDDNIKLTVSDIFEDPRLLALAAKATNIDKIDEVLNITQFGLVDKRCRESLFSQELRQNYNFADNIVFHDAYPYTKLQEGLMALAEKHPGSYVAKFIYRLHSNVDLLRFRRTFEETVRMCPNLRTRCVVAGRAMIQVIVENDIAWEEPECQGLQAYMESMKSFNMGYGSRLSRYALVEDDGALYFAWALHHSIFDGWTMRIMMNVFTSLYEGHTPLNLQPYNRFVEYVANIDHEAASDYWRIQLQGANRAIFPPYSNSNGGSSSSQTLTRPVELITASISITKATIIRAAWALLLARYCDTYDICFGATVSGRQAPVRGLSEMPGPAIATVPIRVQLNKQQSRGEYLRSIQTQAAEMVLFEQFGLQEISKLNSESDEACKFSTLLVIQPLHHLTDDKNAVMVLADEDSQEDSMLRNYFSYPLVVQGHINDELANLVFIYDSKVIPERQIQAMSCQLEHIMRQLVLEQELPLGTLPLSCSWDLEFSQQVNDEVPEIIESCIHTIIEHEAKMNPDAVAIHAWDKEFTYGQLNTTANRLAHYLIEKGVKHHDFVLVCFDKSVWYFVSILAINKAGAAWVPIDPSHPPQRQQQIASQTKAQLTLASANNVEKSRLLTSNVMEISSSLDINLMRKNYSGKDPSLQVSPQHAAYVLFTSGSTGVPKGLIMEHGAVCTSQTAISKRLGLTSRVKMLQFASFVFDLSIGEIIAPLLSGACICVPSEDTRMNGLVEYIRDAGVNWAFLTPSFVRTLRPTDVPSLELLLLAGEAVPRDVFDSWFGKVRLVNAWGPAETCVFSTLHEWKSANGSPLTIGKPVGGLCWIVDSEDHSRLAPVGTIGEIIIQGPTLLREYLADPDRTNASIVQSPGWAPLHDQTHWDKCYKSGDLGYLNPDGTLEFSARKDTQIKIHGLRIEASEVEFHIQRLLADARQVAVDVFRNKNSSTLVAYFCSNDETKTTSIQSDMSEKLFLSPDGALQDRLKMLVGELSVVLPRYMVPAMFIPCKYMPFSTSTKLDRKMLHKHSSLLSRDQLAVYSLSNGIKRQPETKMEQRLQTIWAEILNVPMNSISKDDTFFQLGGDSIKAIYLVSTAKEDGIAFTVKDVFDDPRLFSVASKAISIHEDDADVTESTPDPFSLLSESRSILALEEKIRKECGLKDGQSVKDAYPCSALQEGLIALTVKQPGSYVATYVYHLSKSADISRFKDAWDTVVEVCSNLRTRIVLLNALRLRLSLITTVIGNPPKTKISTQ